MGSRVKVFASVCAAAGDNASKESNQDRSNTSLDSRSDRRPPSRVHRARGCDERGKDAK